MIRPNTFGHIFLTLLVLASSLLAGGEATQRVDEERGKIPVTVVIEELASIVREIGGERIDVSVLIPSGVDPHEYEPPGTLLIEKLSQSRLVVVTARHHLLIEEKIYQLSETGLLKGKIVGFDDYVRSGLQPLTNPITGETNFHGFYFATSGVKAVARAAASALSQIDTEGRGYYHERMQNYVNYVDLIGDKAKHVLDKGYRVILYTPILQYLVQDLGLELVDVVVADHGVEISERDVSRMLEKLKRGEADLLLLTDIEAMENPKLVDLLVKNRLKFVVVPVTQLAESVELTSLSTALLLSSMDGVYRGSESEFPVLLTLSMVGNVVLAVMLASIIYRVRRIGS